jgi:hypothetical protein
MKYKNISEIDLTIPGVGKVKAGAVVETKVEINNANFVKEQKVETAPKEADKKDKK